MTELEGLLRDHGHAPEHGPDFEARLWTAIASGPAGATAPAGPMPPAARAKSRRRARGRRVAALAAVGAVAAALILGFALARDTVHRYAQPAPASAAERVAVRVRAALGNIRTLQADYTAYFKVVKGPPASAWKPGWTTADWWARARIYSDQEFKSLGMENASPYFPTEHIAVRADGMWRKDAPENGSENPPVMVDQYSADNLRGTYTEYSPPEGILHVTTGTSLGAPDDGTGGGVAVDLSVNFIRPATLAALANGTVRQTTVEGRPALTLSCRVPPQPIDGLNMDSHYFDTVALTVDRETWLIVRWSLILRGQVVWDERLTHVRVNEPLASTQLRPSAPAGTPVRERTAGFRRISFDEAAHAWPTTPLEPRALPSGFGRFAAAVSSATTFTYWDEHGGKGYWPRSHDITQLAYSSGLLRFLVTTRAQRSGGELPADLLTADPFEHESVADRLATPVEQVELTGGAWRGTTAYVVMPILGSPHLWAWKDGVLVTVGGDVTREQLLAVANSLEPMD